MSAHAVKIGPKNPTASPGRLVTYREVLAALGSDYARFLALGLYRRAGYSAADFTRQPRSRVAMMEALIATEDALELRGVRREREAIRSVRRRLEDEVSS